MNQHTPCIEQQEAYLFGAMSDAEEQTFRHHLEQCTSCQRAIEEHESLGAWLPPLPTPAPTVTEAEHNALLAAVFARGRHRVETRGCTNKVPGRALEPVLPGEDFVCTTSDLSPTDSPAGRRPERLLASPVGSDSAGVTASKEPLAHRPRFWQRWTEALFPTSVSAGKLVFPTVAACLVMLWWMRPTPPLRMAQHPAPQALTKEPLAPHALRPRTLAARRPAPQRLAPPAPHRQRTTAAPTMTVNIEMPKFLPLAISSSRARPQERRIAMEPETLRSRPTPPSPSPQPDGIQIEFHPNPESFLALADESKARSHRKPAASHRSPPPSDAADPDRSSSQDDPHDVILTGRNGQLVPSRALASLASLEQRAPLPQHLAAAPIALRHKSRRSRLR